MEDFKIVDEHLFNYINDELCKKRYPEILQCASSSLGKGRCAREDRWLSITINDTKTKLVYSKGKIQAAIPEKYLKIVKESFAGNNQWNSKEQSLEIIFDDLNCYGKSEANVLDAFLTIVKPICNNINKYNSKGNILTNNTDNQEVVLQTKCLKDIFEMNLSIPDYQRIYCWEEENVYQLWKDMLLLTDDKPYHLGTLILHKKDDVYDIVDGQQRLVTLTLMLSAMGQNESLPLLKQTFQSKEALDYVAYNKYLINNYVARLDDKENVKKRILEKLLFSVLILDSNNLDLAYTFFSNQNSKGKPLSDYNLLKAHHLRYVAQPAQAKHVAQKWDALLSTQDNDAEKDVKRTLGMFLFRLRKWMRKKTWDEDAKYRVKNEFEAALTIPDIPGFGEQFQFDEPIQGGTHFFVYAEKFVHQFKAFRKTQIYKLLDTHLQYESHWRFKDVIQTMLFGYYLKFGDNYLNMAFEYIEPIVSRFRYENKSVRLYKLLEYAGNSEIVMMIGQATSPTFFLAEAKDRCDRLPKFEPINIASRYKAHIETIKKELNAK